MDATKTAKLQHELQCLDGCTLADNSKGARQSLKLGSKITDLPSDGFEPNVESHMVYSTSLASDTFWNYSPNSIESWICEVVDVEAAFLEGDVEEDVFLEWPDGVLDIGFEDQDTIDENCILLKKGMNGKVQGGLHFFKKLVKSLTLIGL